MVTTNRLRNVNDDAIVRTGVLLVCEGKKKEESDKINQRWLLVCREKQGTGGIIMALKSNTMYGASYTYTF